MKRFCSLLLAFTLLLGLFGMAQAESSFEPVDIRYKNTIYSVKVESVAYVNQSVAEVTITAPDGEQLIRLMNGDAEMGMTPQAGVTLDLLGEGSPFFSAVDVLLGVAGETTAPQAISGSPDGVTFTFAPVAADAILLLPHGGDVDSHVRLVLSEKETPPSASEAPARIDIAQGTMRFTAGGVEYDVLALEDAPIKPAVNMLNDYEGHAVSFAYETSAESEAANKRLYSYTKLITPRDEEIRTYSNDGNVANPYTLYFGLPDDVLLTDCVMRVPADGGDLLIPLGGGVMTQLDTSSVPEATSAPEAPASEQPSATPTKTATGDTDLLGRINGMLQDLAGEATDPWQIAIYEAAARGAVLEDGKAVFMLRSFDPDYKELGNYPGEDPIEWFEGLRENLTAYNLEATVTLGEDGNPDEAGITAVRRLVRTAAQTAQEAFNKKAMRLAIVDRMLPLPMEKITSAEDLHTLEYSELYREMASSELNSVPDGYLAYAPLYFAQVSQSLSVKEGPQALVLNCKGIEDPAQMLLDARTTALGNLSKQYLANQLDEGAIGDVLLDSLVEQANATRKKGGEAFELTFDIDDLLDGYMGDDYYAYINQYGYEDTLDDLAYEVWDLPDAPAQDYPANGYLSGSRNGTKVTIKSPDDGMARYIQMRDSQTDEVEVTMFILAGKQATVYVPKGMYYLMIASGEIWYGEEGLFGDGGRYSRTQETEVLSSQYYHTITLETTVDGNMELYGADMSDFGG